MTKSMMTEGEQIAELLNEAGISAFVLWYRSYPYREPIMFLDAQRAIRYIRYHAADFGVDPKKNRVTWFFSWRKFSWCDLSFAKKSGLVPRIRLSIG